MNSMLSQVQLILSNVDGNNNKYWKASIAPNFDVHVQWGRVGSSGETQIKHFFSQDSAQHFIDGKVREKQRKGYTTFESIDYSADGIVTQAQPVALEVAASTQIRSTSPAMADLIKFLVAQNVHNILANTTMQYQSHSGLFTTPLGIVTQTNIDQARMLLTEIGPYVQEGNYDDSAYGMLLNKYLMLIPQKVGRKLDRRIYQSTTDLQQQNDLLDALAVSFDLAQKPATKDAEIEAPVVGVEQVFSCSLEPIEDASLVRRITDYYQQTKQGMHVASRLRLRTVYAVQVDGMRESFMKHGAPVGNVRELWHGTRTSNLLSILKSGLMVPKSGASHVTGRMFGDGLYFTDQSTKALNYAHGYWGGKGYDNRCFMFLADVALGKPYLVQSRGRETYPMKGYDSTFAEGGKSGVANNEMIVYQTSQANLKYLVEFHE